MMVEQKVVTWSLSTQATENNTGETVEITTQVTFSTFSNYKLDFFSSLYAIFYSQKIHTAFNRIN